MIPCHQESADAIACARRALDHWQRFFLGNVGKVEGELYELGLLTSAERFMTIDIALQEITPADRLGPEPPNNVSSHGPFKNQRLYAFCWNSLHLKKLMYFKFAVARGAGSQLVVYSFHESRPSGVA